MLEADPEDILGGLQGRGTLHRNPSQEEVAPLPSGAVGSRNSRQRMELAGPCLASDFWPGKRSRSRELLPTWEKRKGRAEELWHRAALQARLIHSRMSAPWMIFWQGIRESFC